MNTFDLQIQSTSSDGKYSPRDLVRMARDLGLATIALTDHDTVGGVPEAVAAGQEFGVEVIAGIELSSRYKGAVSQVRVRGFHILGYGIDLEHPSLLSALARLQELRLQRAEEMVRRLQKLGFIVSYEGVLARASGGVVGRPHITLEVIENPANAARLEGIKTIGDFIRRYLVPGAPAYVEVDEAHDLSTAEAIALIHEAGGVAVWSHPAVHFAETLERLEAVLKELLAFGLDGVEVFNPSHTESAVKLLYDLTEHYQLMRTAGSDFHREPAPGITGDGGATLGDFATYGLSIVSILPELKAKMARKSP